MNRRIPSHYLTMPLSPGEVQVTHCIHKSDTFVSCYGRLTGAAWLNEEMMRLRRVGVRCEIRDGNNNTAALIRKYEPTTEPATIQNPPGNAPGN
jgi:hypothetical protein